MKNTQIQFDIISQIQSVLHTAGIPFWLRGGWAVDFLLERITREHSDIDLVAWKRHAVQLRSLFEQADFTFMRDTGVQYDFTKCGQEISVVFISQIRGELFVEGIPDWVWLPEALSLPPQELDGSFCHVLSPAQLLEEKVGYQKDTGRSPRTKDLQSMKTLNQIIMS
ncbi:nucleotidyltransferase domain-containing protein [Candidatus Leptofilum sp.]|uniref:nucleotidyltransferase domain-containing protein n=1 Tax=Candidatus Leptofilum sp. TaxID=3241576 RepID=UPI003B5AA8D6